MLCFQTHTQHNNVALLSLIMDVVLLLCFVSSRWNHELRPFVVHNLKIASLSPTKTWLV